MSTDNSNNGPPADMSRQRRSSVSNPLTSLFQRNGSTAATATAFPINNDQRRRLSISTMGLSGTSPTAVNTPFTLRRGSISTNSDSIDENAIDDEEPASARTAPTTPFTRRMSFGTQAMRNLRMPTGTSPGGSNDQQGFNWSEQLRSRAESIASGSRPSVSYATSPPRPSVGSAAPVPTPGPRHDRAKSVSDMPAPPAQAPKPRPQKPDAFQERILKGDFYMD
ncbi:hypothetical protein NKR19_g6772 [Coniochaeta hoffmannii]|uniref:Uncharacterized protein n=1 Tax=Coniochaeta hoffmannii TaxID=91930 RepID=A0AA38RCU9_9PEZI|nr:hypothetical protein NKR19_g6772 [Coniochaeta hoffmannii]